MTKAVIFDFDGVIVASELPRFQYAKGLLSKRGYEIEESYISKMTGKTSKDFFTEVLEEKNALHQLESIMQEFDDIFTSHITDYITPIALTVNFIKTYSGNAKLAVASMSNQSKLNKALKAYDIYDKFAVILSRDEVKKHKPDPEIYIKAIDKLGFSSQECAVVEDSLLGVQAALSADIPCFVLLNGLNKKASFLDLPIAGFIEKKEDFNKIS